MLTGRREVSQEEMAVGNKRSPGAACPQLPTRQPAEGAWGERRGVTLPTLSAPPCPRQGHLRHSLAQHCPHQPQVQAPPRGTDPTVTRILLLLGHRGLPGGGSHRLHTGFL